MNGARTRFVPAAGQEVEEALDWYLQRSVKAGESFLREFERGLALIAESPRLWPHFEAGARRYVLRKFPFSIVYREIPGGIEIVAVAHQKKRPGYWHGR